LLIWLKFEGKKKAKALPQHKTYEIRNSPSASVKAFRSLLGAYFRLFASGLARPERAEKILEAQGYLACAAPPAPFREGSTP